ncbi:MAG: hypothetical protein R3E13_11135 [Alphaproteobacteria bacterium]
MNANTNHSNPKTSLLKVQTLKEFVTAAHIPSFWARDAKTIEKTREAFLEFMKDCHNGINVSAYVTVDGNAHHNLLQNLPEIIDHEIKAMIMTYHNMHGANIMRIEIGNNLTRESHTHNFNVLNCNWGDLGTGFWKTNHTPVYVPEGMWTNIPVGTEHFSYIQKNKLRSTIAIFEDQQPNNF